MIPHMTDLDDIDRRILRALQRDSTLSMDALAERAGLSRNACWRRMRLLEEAGVIRGRVALLDAEALGCGLQVLVMVRAASHDPDWMGRFERAVRAMPQIVGAYRTSGELDYMLRVRVADVAGYDRFYKRLIAAVPISDVSASFVMEDLKDTTELPITGG